MIERYNAVLARHEPHYAHDSGPHRTAMRLGYALCMLCLIPIDTDAAGKQVGPRDTGTIQGVITYYGDVPESKTRDNSGQRRRLLTVHRRSHGLRDAVVYIELQQADHSKLAHPEIHKDVTSAPVVVDQFEHAFHPHLIAIRAGQKVRFTNSDAANHNVHANAFGLKNEFNVMIGATAEYIHQFTLERKGRPISLRCDLHPWMRGWVFVFDHPYYAVSDNHGRFRIPAVPVGKYRLAIRQPDVDYRKTLAVDVKPQQITRVEVKITPEDVKKR